MNQTVNAPAGIRCDFAAIMDDDSMVNDGIQVGDIVYFAACDHVDNGQIAAVQTPKTMEIRRVWQNGQSIRLIPENTEYMTTVCREVPRDGVQIIGQAVAVLHILNTETEKGQDHEEK